MPDTDGMGPDDRAIVLWLALLRAGAPVGVWVERRFWRNGMRAVAGVSSQMALSYHTQAARDMGLIEVERGSGGRAGRVRLMAPGAPGQFIPDLDVEQLQDELTGGGDRPTEKVPA